MDKRVEASLARYKKDLVMYEEEKNKLSKMLQEESDSYKITNINRMIAETERVMDSVKAKMEQLANENK